MIPALARLKRAAIRAVELNGGSHGAAMTAGKSPATAGNWRNISHEAFPPLDCVFALDQVAVAGGHLPPMLCALARELGGVFVPAIDISADEGSPAFLAMQLAQTLGEVSGEIARSLADDNMIDDREAASCLDKLHAHNRIAAQLGQQLEKILKERK